MALTQVDQGLLGTYAQYTGFKNRLINGQMQIDQRNAGASVSPTTGQVYELDRWNTYRNASGAFSVQQVSDGPTGFTKSAKITVTSAYAGSSEQYNFAQFIEGNNISDLGFGGVSASNITLSFWVKSSVTGTFSAAITNYAGDASYPFTYTISAANTWEQKTKTISGATIGTWPTDTSASMRVIFDLGTQTSVEGTANTWSAGYYYRVAGSVRLIATNAATIQFTGVQLEKGSTATSFDYRPYGTELALCQRYYQRITANASSGIPFPAALNPGTTSNQPTYFPVVIMRTAPSMSSNANAWGYCRNGGSFTTYATNAIPSVGSGATSAAVPFYAAVASGLTSAGLGLTYIEINNWIDFSSEL